MLTASLSFPLPAVQAIKNLCPNITLCALPYLRCKNWVSAWTFAATSLPCACLQPPAACCMYFTSQKKTPDHGSCLDVAREGWRTWSSAHMLSLRTWCEWRPNSSCNLKSSAREKPTSQLSTAELSSASTPGALLGLAVIPLDAIAANALFTLLPSSKNNASL